MATNFLWASGASNSGLLGSVVTLMTTELNSITNGSVIVSSVGGTSGLFTNSNTSQGIWADLFFFAGNPGITPTSGGNISGWFLTSPDSGTTLELTTAAPARSPEFIIPLAAAASSTTATVATGRSQGLIRVPATQFKVLIQNNSGVTLSTGGTTAQFLKMAISAIQY